MKPLRIGTRGSPLALWQARHIEERLRQLQSAPPIEIVVIETQGDRAANASLSQIGGEGVFTKAIQDAVLEGKADVAVHSMKDLPTAPVAGLALAAVPERASVFDVLVSKKYRRFDDLPHGAKLATGSLRRQAQLLHRRPDIRLVDIRGNVDTRLRKLTELGLDGLILAEAGLSRLGLQTHITEVFDVEWMLPAVGQGALALECRSDDAETKDILSRLDDYRCRQGVLAERAVLRALGGGCQIPLGVRSQCASDTGKMHLTAAVLSQDGSKRVADHVRGRIQAAEELGNQLAETLLRAGAKEILAQ
ncbi:MAG TPA: hydroxymethylbilane synthase [Gemmataceae bacterium]|jgi:hydroxymethylbilane synthase|nr:hydroxymethylbilane synthase [Gemmataceae bacterium]